MLGLSPAVFRICAEEARRTSVVGYDYEDLLQEAAIVATMRGYGACAKTSIAVRQRLHVLRVAACRYRRAPHDVYGRALPVLSLELLPPASGADVTEAALAGIQLHRAYAEAPRAMRVLERAYERGGVDGVLGRQEVIANARALVQRVLSDGYRARGRDMVEAQATELPECHADGEKPEGYSKDELTSCGLCPDKFSCIPATLKRKMAPGLTPETDQEYLALSTGLLTRDQVLQRMLDRERLILNGEPVPPELDPFVPIKVEKPVEAAPKKKLLRPKKSVPPAAKAETQPPAAPAKKNGAAAKASAKKNGAASKAAPAKETAKKGPVPPKKVRMRATATEAAKPIAGRDRWRQKPRAITAEQMATLIRGGSDGHTGVRIGQWFDLQVGHVLCRKKRDGTKVKVVLRENGFEYDGRVYSSLSAACMQAEGRSVSGNDFFHLEKSKHSVTVEDEHGVVLFSAARL